MGPWALRRLAQLWTSREALGQAVGVGYPRLNTTRLIPFPDDDVSLLKGKKTMPFPTQTATPFKQASIEALPLNQLGCYGLFVGGGRWIYVGKGNIRERLLSHRRGENPCILGENPTHFYTMLTADADADEKRLIVELNPVCNQKVG